MNMLVVVFIIFVVRLASVFIVRTYFVPDEYWQSLEVAHKITFGYGYLTWEWVRGLRSYIYPVLIACIYRILALLNLDTTQFLVILPRMLQATLSTYSDYRFYIWCGKRKWALFLILVSWFWFYTGSRTLANTLENSLTTIALSYFPWYGEGTAYLWPTAICCFLRPTAAVIWLPLCYYHVQKSRLSALEITKRFAFVGLSVASVGITVDTYYHGRIIITPYEFLRYNILHNIGSFYGSHPFHWYFTAGLPTVLGVNTLPFIFAVVETLLKVEKYPVRKQLLITIMLALIAFSAIEHKEFRFVSSLLPLCTYIIADFLTRFSYRASRFILWLIAGIIVFGNFTPAWYASRVYQKGPIELMPKLQDIAQNYHDERGHHANILFLMPCHSTPYYSHVHQNVTMRFLTCEPNFQQEPNYKDEADQFFDSPVHWLRSHIPSYPKTALPTHIILFDTLADKINELLINYKLLHSIEYGTPEQLLNDWKDILRKNELKIDAILNYVQIRLGKNILVFQRLRVEEENTFNRAEYEAQNNILDEGTENKSGENIFN